MKTLVILAAFAGTKTAALAQTAISCPTPTGTAPAGITVTAVAPNLVIAWNPVPRAAGYAVIRRNPDGTCWALTPAGTTATTFQEATPATPGRYGYQIGARLGTGANGFSPFVTHEVPVPPTIVTPPPRGKPTVLDDAQPPGQLTVTGTPTTATLTWTAPSGAIHYRVNRAPAGTTGWSAVTPTPITATTVTEVLPNPAQPYTYSVLAYRKDGHFGAAAVDFTAPPPTNPTGLTGAASGSAVTLSWQPVPHAARYAVRGPGIAGTPSTKATSYTVAAAPAGPNVYRVGSIFDPGALQTPASAWSAVTVSVVVPATCACTATGPFTAPAFTLLTAKGLSTSFASPAGTFRIEAQSIDGNDKLDIFDSSNRPVFSENNPAGWGLSPDRSYFVVVMPPVSSNAGVDVRVFPVRQGPRQWSVALDIDVWPNGYWGFSAENSQFIVSQSQGGQFSFQAFNLRAANPRMAKVEGTGHLAGSRVTTSPCGDQLLFARWTQLSPLAGQGEFYSRSSYGSGRSPLITYWDGVVQVTPTASAVAGPSPKTFLVQLNGLQTASGQNTIPSLQCSP